MTDQEQQRACAELDGWTDIGIDGVLPNGSTQFTGSKEGLMSCFVPNYSTYDAIIPLIQKQSREAKRQIGWFTVYFKGGVCDTHYDATPAQLREALLRATGKWKD